MSTFGWEGLQTGAGGLWGRALDWSSANASATLPGAGDTAVLGWWGTGPSGTAHGGAYTVATEHFSSYSIGTLDLWSYRAGTYDAPMLDLSKGSSLTVTGNIGESAARGTTATKGGFIHLWNGATLTVDGTVASGETVWFHGTPDTLNLGGVGTSDPTAFAGRIRDFGVHDKIDFTSVAWQRGFHESYDATTHELLIKTATGQEVAQLNLMFAPGPDGAGHINLAQCGRASGDHHLLLRRRDTHPDAARRGCGRGSARG